MMQRYGSLKAMLRMTLCILLCLCFCASAAASGVEIDEEGGTWDYDRGIYTDPTGAQYEITPEGVDEGGSSGATTTQGEGGAIIIDTGEQDELAGAVKKEDGSIEIESGTYGVDIEESPTRAPLEGEAWQAALDGVAARNGKDTPTVWTNPATGEAVAVEVVYMGIGRSMIVVDGQKKLVNTVDLKWQTEAPEDKVLAVVRHARYAWLHKSPSSDKKVLKFKQVYRNSVLRVLATGRNWTFVDHEGDRAYVPTSTLEFYANDHTEFEGGYLSLNGKIKGKGRVQVRDFASDKIVEGFQPGTPVTVFDILDDFGYAEIDVAGWHCVVRLECLTLERSLASAE